VVFEVTFPRRHNAAEAPRLELPDNSRDEIPDSAEGWLVPPGYRTAAEELNPRPDDGTKYSPGVGRFDSAYHSYDADGDFMREVYPPTGPVSGQRPALNLGWIEDFTSTMTGVGGVGGAPPALDVAIDPRVLVLDPVPIDEDSLWQP